MIVTVRLILTPYRPSASILITLRNKACERKLRLEAHFDPDGTNQKDENS